MKEDMRFRSQPKSSYRVVFLTAPPDFQNEKQAAANQS